MVNPPRAKGTKAETAVVNWWKAAGEPQVERHALHGGKDVGDINGVPGLVVSVKAPGQGQPVRLSGALSELQGMRGNATPVRGESLPYGLLVVRRVGFPSPGDWYAVQPLAQWWDLYRELLT